MNSHTAAVTTRPAAGDAYAATLVTLTVRELDEWAWCADLLAGWLEQTGMPVVADFDLHCAGLTTHTEMIWALTRVGTRIARLTDTAQGQP